jgi:hypothetical protein
MERLTKLAEKGMEGLTKLAEKLLEYLNRTEAFMSEQVPDVIQQFLQWKMVEAGVYVAVGLLLIALALRLWRRWNWIWVSADAIPFLPPMIGLIGGGFLVLSNGLTMLQIWIAPKVFLIELVKGWLTK